MFNSSTQVESECKYENSTWQSIYLQRKNLHADMNDELKNQIEVKFFS